MRRLSQFIRENTEEILQRWEDFARSLEVGVMDIPALRDHALEMLLVIADDLDTPQTAAQQTSKSEGRSHAARRKSTAAQLHGADRAESGFSISQMVAEFRALRASVLDLWARAAGAADSTELQDMTRFNEAIDQAITESIARFTSDIDAYKERFIAILGHDLVTPISAITTASKFMQSAELPEPHNTLVQRIDSSATRMQRMVSDLLDFTRTRLGDAIPIVRTRVDLREVLQAAITEVAAAHQSSIEFRPAGDLVGNWDRERLMQVAANLLGNAVQHGQRGTPITVTADGTAQNVVFSVRNMGALPGDDSSQLFSGLNPTGAAQNRDRRHLGLGLFIVDRIVKAHGGTIVVTSSEAAGTEFTVTLPR